MNFELVILVVIIIGAFFLIFYKYPAKYTTVKIGNATVRAEIADTWQSQMRGLMFRSYLAPNDGMLFVFSREDIYSFWMMNTSIPLDMIWIDSNHKVVYIQKDTQPCFMNCQTYNPGKVAQYVLEVNAGFSDAHNIKIGTQVDFTL